MTLSDLRQTELALMRQAFESACVLAGLTLDSEESDAHGVYAGIASTIQRLVESGIADPDVIARFAVGPRKAESLIAI